ncbi:MAG: VIT1/CCC1 transporter family protein [Acidimicrobiales bacterium]
MGITALFQRPEAPSGEAHDDHTHRDVKGGAARAAIFGVSDGLVSNVSLILGVAGASPAPGVVRLAGLAGLLAGACSMAAGEYVSVQAQRELLERELAVERQELELRPEMERRELAGIYRSRGVDAAVADAVAAQLSVDPETALEAHAREELGIDPRQLGSPQAAAASSFVAFTVGAVIPLVPWLIGRGTGAVVASVVLSAMAAILIGVVLAGFTGRSVLVSSSRQLAVAAVAAGITFAVGTALGVTGTV